MSEYAEKMAAMSDAEYLKEAETMVWLSAYAANTPRSAYHKKCDDCYTEATRRGKPWLYKAAWNRAYASKGYQLSDDDLDGAKPPLEREDR